MPKAPKDYTGQRFGRLLVLRRAPEYNNINYNYWWCRCDCGTEFPTDISSVIRGKTVSCGCYRSERARMLCSMNIRKCMPCEVSFPDGRVERFPSSNLASRAAGVSATTVCHHLRTGKPYAGMYFKPIASV